MQQPRDLTVPATVVAAGLMLIAGVAALSSSAVRHQLALSFTRQQGAYTELAFPSTVFDKLCERDEKGQVTVRFTMARSGDTALLRYAASVEATGGMLDRKSGEEQLALGETRTITERLGAPPSGDFEIRVVSGSARLLARCGAT